MADVNVRGAKVEVRTVPLTRSLLKQVRRVVYKLPHPFFLPYEEGEQREVRFNPEFLVGWFRGTVLGEEHDDFFLFSRDGDLFLYPVSRYNTMKHVSQTKAKQLYL